MHIMLCYVILCYSINEPAQEKYGYVHISTGDILRENVKAGTELGLKARGFMNKTSISN